MKSVDQSVLTSLRGWAAQLRHALSSEVQSVYVFGSLVNAEGRMFSKEMSDIDLLVATKTLTAEKQQALAAELKQRIASLEVMLAALMNRHDAEPVSSTTIVSQFELNEGVHKDRNSRIFFAARSFLRIDIHSEQLEQAGNALPPDLLGPHFTAWTVLANAQAFRNKYLRCTPSGPSILQFDSPTIKLPKDLLRNAYAGECYSRRADTAYATVDDTAKGLKHLEKLLEQRQDDSPFARELLELLESNRPGGKGRRLPVPANLLLFAWDILSEGVRQKLAANRSEQSLDRQKFAANETREELEQFQATHLTCVDQAVQLYRGEGITTNQYISTIVARRYSRDLYELKQIDADDVTRLAAEWPRSVQKFLEERRDREGSGVSNCKVGFARLDYSQIAVGNKAKLHIRPLSYWVTRQFNKELARKKQVHTESLRKEYFERIVCSAEDFLCECPSQLFVETVIITSDGWIPIMSKNTSFSVAGVRHAAPVLTCGPELGLEWARHVREESSEYLLDIEAAVLDGLALELSIPADQVSRWRIECLALQSLHLNTALLGIVVLTQSRSDLSMNLEGRRYFSEPLEFLAGSEILDRIQSDFGKEKWHPTALMRLSLAAEYLDSIE